MRLMLAFLLACSISFAQEATDLWQQLAARRAMLPGFHQNIEVSEVSTTQNTTQTSKRKMIVDVAGTEWREQSLSGWGASERVYRNGELIDARRPVNEYTVENVNLKKGAPEPFLYCASCTPDLARATVVERHPCGFVEDHSCVTARAKMQPIRTIPNTTESRIEGALQFVADETTGLLVDLQIVELRESYQGSPRIRYRHEARYRTIDLSWRGGANFAVLTVDISNLKKVKRFSAWDAKRLEKEMVGKPAPDLAAVGLRGEVIQLSDHKDEVVLLDLWASWCPPCRSDAPELEKLHSKYESSGVTLMGISVGEAREAVEEFLKKHPAPYVIALTSENQLPAEYQFNSIPTYVLIDRDGNIAGAASGSQGF